jgi:hypothetical protein
LSSTLPEPSVNLLAVTDPSPRLTDVIENRATWWSSPPAAVSEEHRPAIIDQALCDGVQ